MKPLITNTITILLLAVTSPAFGNALTDAAKQGHAAEVRQLLDAGVDVNAGDIVGYTPLHYAVWQGHTNVVRTLLTAGANARARTNNNPTKVPLDTGETITVHTLDGWTALHIAAFDGRREMVKLLLEAGAEVHDKTNKGMTPLHYAAMDMDGHPDVIKLLLAAGANVQATTNDGWTALHLAAMNGSDVVKLLLAAGANVQATTNDGRVFPFAENLQTRSIGRMTALQLAAGNNRVEVVSLLLAAGAEVNALDDYGRSALTLADDGGHTAVVKLLKDAGALSRNPEQGR